MASPAVQLLQSMAASMARIEAQGTAMGTQRPRDSAADRVAELQDAIDEQKLARLRAERVKLTKSEIFQSVRDTKTREEARKALQRVTAEMNKLRQTTTADITSIRNVRTVMLDFATSLRGVSESERRKLSKHFDGLGGMFSGLSEAARNGEEGIKRFLAQTLDQTDAAARLLEEYQDVVAGMKQIKRLDAAQQADLRRRERELGERLHEQLREMTGESASDMKDAARKLDRVITDTTQEVASSVSDLSDALSKSSTIVARNNTQMTRMGDAWKQFTSNPIVKFGAAAVGANMLFNKGDGSSVIGDLTSAYNTGVDTPYISGAIQAGSYGMSVAEMRRAIVETAGESAVTKTEMARIFQDTFATGGTGYRAMLGAFHGDSTALAARLIQEQSLGNALGANPADIQRMAQQRINMARNMEDAGMGSAQHLLDLSDQLIGTTESFAIFRQMGLRNQLEYQRGFTEFSARMQLMGVTVGKTSELIKQAGAGLNQTFEDQTKDLGERLAMYRMAGASEATLSKLMRASWIGDNVAIQEATVKAQQEIAPRVQQMVQDQSLGSGRASTQNRALLSRINSHIPGGVTGILDAQNELQRASALSPEKRQELRALTVSADSLNRLTTEADSFTARLQEWTEFTSSMLRKNTVAAAVAGIGGVALSAIANAVMMRFMVGRLLKLPAMSSLLSRLPSLGGALASSTATAPAAAAAARVGAPAAAGVGGRAIGARLAGPAVALASGAFTYMDARGEGDSQGRSLSRGAGSMAGAAAGLWGGMAAGAALGTMIPIPVVGTLLGALIGGGLAYAGSKAGDAIGASIHDAASGGDVATPSSMTEQYQGLGLERAITTYGEQTVAELQTLNKGVAALVGFAAAKAIPDRRERNRTMQRIYRADTQYASGY